MQTSDILFKLIPFTHKEGDSVFFTTHLSFGDWIVTSIEVVLIIVFFYSVIRLWLSYKRDLKSTDLLVRESDLLNKQGFEYYNDFLHNIKSDKKIAHLWSEFDESLIKENGKYENSLDADYFFNSNSLASHVGSKFYSAIPGILLGIGLLGTFFALYVALIELNLDGDGLKDSIRVFIGMVGVKFTASVWGIFLSVAFTFYEKMLEGKLSTKIRHLQDNIDGIFKRQTAEQNLFRIASEAEQQTRAMNSLAETLTQKISDQFNPMLSQMNNHLEQMPNHISRAIGETLSGPLAELKNSAQNAAASQSESLESIVSTFIEKLDQSAGDQIQGVQNMMAQTTQELTQLLGSIKEISENQNMQMAAREAKMQELFNRTMTSFEEQMSKIQEVFGAISQEASTSLNEMHQKQQASLESERSTMLEQMQTMKNDFEKLSGSTNIMMQDMFASQQKALSVERESITQHSEKVSTQIQNALVKMAEQSGDRDEKLHKMMEMIQNKHLELFDKNKQFANEMEESMARIMGNVVQKVNEVQTMINATTDKLSAVPSMLNTFENSSENLRSFGDSAKEATLTLNGAVEELRNAQKSISAQLEHAKEQTSAMSTISTSTEAVSKSGEIAAKNLQETYSQLIDENSANFDQLGEAMAKWLTQYDNQVHATMQNALNEVQSALTTFASTLTQSMGSLEDAIESINSKVQG